MRVFHSRPGFQEPAHDSDIHDERLVIHRRTKKIRNKHLVIFVHGLGGSRYGDSRTWGKLPEFIYDDFPNVDVGMYSYRTLLRRLLVWRSIPVEDEAQVLASEIASLDDYESILLVGHSLGGLVCKCALASLVDSEDSKGFSRISGILLIATPQLGSLSVPRMLAWLTEDMRCLSAHSRFIQRIHEIFDTRIGIDVSAVNAKEHHTPVWAVVASDDYWVDKLSAGIGIPRSQRKAAPGSHTQIVKPRDRNQVQYKFFVTCVQHMLGGPIFRFRGHDTRPARSQELTTIHDLARREFGSNVSDVQLMTKWRDRNADVFWIVRRVHRTATSQTFTQVGYFALLPLTQQAYDDIVKGKITGATIPASSIEADTLVANCIYVGAVLGTDLSAKGAAMDGLNQQLNFLARRRPLQLLTRPVTKDGLRLVESFNFEPVDSASVGMGKVYKATLELLH